MRSIKKDDSHHLIISHDHGKVSPFVVSLLETPLMRCLLRDLGGFIAGGFARQCYLGKMNGYDDLFNYVHSSESSPLSSGYHALGDIDVFFHGPSRISQFRDSAELLSFLGARRDIRGIVDVITISHAKLALNVPMGTLCTFPARMPDPGGRIQLITHPDLRGDVHHTLGRFDLVNAKCAIIYDENRARQNLGAHVLMHDIRLQELETSGQLLVQCSNSPMLPRRCLKYLLHRGLKSMHPDSMSHLYDWVLHHVANNAMGSPLDQIMSHANNRLNKRIITCAAELGILTREMLAMMHGLHTQREAIIDDSYHLIGYQTRDIALDAMRALDG